MISEQTLINLKNLLQAWGISPDDWYITGEAAMILSGYPVTFREQQMDVLVCREVWPWPRPEEQVSLFPDTGTLEEKQLREFIEKNNITPDFHPLPHVGIEATDRFDHSYIFSPTSDVRVLNPWAGVWHRKLIIEFYEQTPGFSLKVFDKNKFLRWQKFIEEIQRHAELIGDKKTAGTCLQVLPVVQRAIKFFETDNDKGFLRGLSVCPGRVTGPVAFWQDGADLSGKIVVLKHALPYQFSQLAKARGIITEEGGLLSHAAVIAREYNVPAIVGITKVTQNLVEGDEVELDADQGRIKIKN
ncbi:MAG: PEP-utilizing enzyme [Candidatus Uhrbacteria bacterium]